MAQIIVALIGPGKGPLVPLAKRQSVLRVSGMLDGAASVFVDNQLHCAVSGNGNFELPEDGEFVCVDYSGKSKTLIAEVVRKS